MEATFEHGDGDKGAYGLWLDDSIKDDPIYSEHWVEQTELRVTFEPDRIVLERPRDQVGAAKAAETADEDPDADKGSEDEDRDERDDLEGGSDANVGEEDDEEVDDDDELEDEDEK